MNNCFSINSNISKMKATKNKSRSVFGKLIAGATAGAALGLVTYMFFKSDRADLDANEKLASTKESKESLFV